MMPEITMETSIAVNETGVSQTVRSLAAALKATPEFQALLQAAQAVHTDETVQNLLRQIRIRQSGLQLSQHNPAGQARTTRELQAELEAQPAVWAYRQAEPTARELFLAVDAAIGATAGVDFAANAKRSCCG